MHRSPGRSGLGLAISKRQRRPERVLDWDDGAIRASRVAESLYVAAPDTQHLLQVGFSAPYALWSRGGGMLEALVLASARTLHQLVKRSTRPPLMIMT